jgi:L-fuconolactonase
MKIIDSHQHFWHFRPERDTWITEEMSVLRKDFMPGDLRPVLEKNGVEGCIAVQADQSESETEFLLSQAERHDFIRGVVGWVDLRSPDVDERLEALSQRKYLCGFRHIVQSEPDVNFLLREDFQHGIEQLNDYGFTYDILVFPHQLGAVLEFVRRFPEQPFVIDHLAKPYIKDGFIDGWTLLMREISRCENVCSKVSGLVTEADWERWHINDFIPYLDVAFEAFSPDRLLFGSDWPVCLLAATYDEVLGLVGQYAAHLDPSEQEKFFYKNAVDFYGLQQN